MSTKLFNTLPQTNLRRILRGNTNKSEMILWKQLRNNKLGFKFRRQYGIGRYVVDFYCAQAKLVVEIDGLTHYDEKVYENDVKRQRYLESLGMVVKRYNSSQVFQSLGNVLEDLYNVCCERIAILPHPTLSL